MEYDQFLLNADHRCLWIDITYQQAFGHNMVAIPHSNTRCITCRDPRIVQNYVAQYEALAVTDNLQKKSLDLLTKAWYPITEALN